MLTKRVYLFSGTQYCRFDIAQNAANSFQYPAEIARWWRGLPAGPIDAALNWGLNKVFFFVGPNYFQWNVLTNQVEAGHPQPIAGNWGFDGTGFENGIDAAVNWGNGKVYFFKGDQYIRVDWATALVEPNYPKNIGQFWKGLTAVGFDRDIDDVVNLGNGKAYLFKGSRYVRFDLTTLAVDPGYPAPIDPNWPGVFPGGITAALEWPIAKVDDNGGFRVPLNSTACRTAPSGLPGLNWGGRTFQMEVDFVDTEYPQSKSVGEYRQLVRGHFIINGHRRVHGLPSPIPGAPAVPMNDRVDPVTGAPGEFLEDGLTAPPPGRNVWYGHRIDLVGNADPTDRYGTDRILDGDYHGFDMPGPSFPPGTTFTIAGDFLGQAVDSANGGEVLTSAQWSVDCTGIL